MAEEGAKMKEGSENKGYEDKQTEKGQERGILRKRPRGRPSKKDKEEARRIKNCLDTEKFNGEENGIIKGKELVRTLVKKKPAGDDKAGAT